MPNASILKIVKFEIFNILVKNISLLKNPLNGGNPAIEKLPIMASVKLIGMKCIRPP